MIQLKSYCKFLVLIILNFNLVRLQYYSNQNPKASITRRPNYFLRWVLNDPILPIYIEKPTTKEADYKWFKYPQERFIDEIENYETNYLYSQKVDKTILYIVEYNNKSHEQLGTYEPVAIGLRTDEYDVVDAKSYEPADLYTLVYLESHFIDRVVDVYDSNKINFFCNISLLMPNNKMHELNQANLKLIERSVNLKMGFFNNYHHGKEEIKHSDVSVADNGKHKHMGKSMRVMISVLKHNINNLTRLKRSSKNFNSNSFIQVNYEIGPITIPKSQMNLYGKNERNLSCRLNMFELDNGNDYENFASRRIDDTSNYKPTNNRPTQQTTTRRILNTLSQAARKEKKINSSNVTTKVRSWLVFLLIFMSLKIIQ